MMSCDIHNISHDVTLHHVMTLLYSAMRLLEDATQCLHVKELAR